MVLLFCSTSGFAWGQQAHRAIAIIAWDRLDANAREQVQTLLGSKESFIDLSFWADQIRPMRRETAPWHYVNIPLETGAYDKNSMCLNRECIVEKIPSLLEVLADRSLLIAVRAEALKWVTHLYGDIHQPLHCADDNDRGGNEVWVRLNGKTERLHSLWDRGLIERLAADEYALARLSSGQENSSAVAAFDNSMGQWALQSFQIARDLIYRESRGRNSSASPILLPADYVERAAPVIKTQIYRAGVRLAAGLNNAFGR